jgi:hypothetical protein
MSARGKALRALGHVLWLGGSLATLAGAGLLSWVFPGAPIVVGTAVVGVLASVTAGVTFVLQGRRLERFDGERESAAKEEVFVRLAKQRGGAMTAAELARPLGLSDAEADLFLTELMKRRPDQYTVDVNEVGQLVYSLKESPRLRVALPPDARGGADGALRSEATHREEDGPVGEEIDMRPPRRHDKA